MVDRPDPKPSPPNQKEADKQNPSPQQVREDAAKKDAQSSASGVVSPSARSSAPGVYENVRRTEDRSKDDQAAAKRPKPRPYRVNKQADAIDVEARGAYDDLVGELFPGESGWLPLDDVGTPAGPAVRELPDPPQRACRVMANGQGAPGDILVTISGAPITPVMQPNTDILPWVAPPEIPVAGAVQRQSQRSRDREEDRNRIKEREEDRDRKREEAQQSEMQR